MSNNQEVKIDPQTGLKERTVDIETMLDHKGALEKPRGRDLFKRVSPTVDYVEGQKKQELWLYNRRMLTGVDSEIVAMDEYNNIIHGINFASADYLGLAQNDFAKEAAI